MANIIRAKRGVKANLNTLAGSSSLLAGEFYFLTDTDRLALGKSTTTYNEYLPVTAMEGQITFVIDGGGVAIAANQQVDLPDFPFPATITGWTITADVSGSAVVTISKATYANFPTFTDISGTEKPTLSSAQKNQDLTLTTWTTALAQGDTLRANVDSASTVKRLSITLRFVRT